MTPLPASPDAPPRPADGFDLAALAQALEVGPDRLALVRPAKGLAHDHVRVDGLVAVGGPVMARVPRRSQIGLGAEANLAYQAAAFTRAQPSGRTPALHRVVPPRPGLPGGALLIEAIDGATPRPPDDMPALAETLAAIHRLPTPAPSSRAPLVDQSVDPLRHLRAQVERQIAYFDHIDLAHETRAALANVIERARLQRLPASPAPVALALSDTHPGNFLMRSGASGPGEQGPGKSGGQAVFVDLEKAFYGCPALDLAHASLPSSTVWDVDVDWEPRAADVIAFHRAYARRAGPARMQALAPWLAPFRPWTWLRTLGFMARLIAEGGPPAHWDKRQAAHARARIAWMFRPDIIVRTAGDLIDLDLGDLSPIAVG
jgi:aminoglycoside phosphotransferase (APT) family kinase protein